MADKIQPYMPKENRSKVEGVLEAAVSVLNANGATQGCIDN